MQPSKEKKIEIVDFLFSWNVTFESLWWVLIVLKKLVLYALFHLKFSKCWVSKWMKEYCVSLRSPNKRFCLSNEYQKIRIIDFLENITKARNYFWSKYGVDLLVINKDQMPPHRWGFIIYRQYLYHNSSLNVCPSLRLIGHHFSMFVIWGALSDPCHS